MQPRMQNVLREFCAASEDIEINAAGFFKNEIFSRL